MKMKLTWFVYSYSIVFINFILKTRLFIDLFNFFLNLLIFIFTFIYFNILEFYFHYSC